MVYTICYCAKYPYGELLDKEQPFKNAFIEAKNEKEAIASLKRELPGLKLAVYSIKS